MWLENMNCGKQLFFESCLISDTHRLIPQFFWVCRDVATDGQSLVTRQRLFFNLVNKFFVLPG